MSTRRIPVLVYHHVYPDEAPELIQATFETGAGVIGASAFRRQVQTLVDNGWSVVTTTQLLDWLTDDAALPRNSVVLHFDNGWLDTVTVAAPILSSFGLTATCFPITDGVEAAQRGQSAAVRTLTEGVVEKPFANWEQIEALLEAGWEIGAHSATHCKMADKLASEGDGGVMREAETSNALFESRLGAAPAHFAYPSGSRNERTDQLLAGYYRSLRLWHFDWPITWSFTDDATSPLAIDCQNIDLRVSHDQFERIFEEALAPGATR